MPQVVGFTGTRDGMTPEQKITVTMLLKMAQAVAVCHGDCIGADADFHDIALEQGINIVLHPPGNPSKRAFKVEGVTFVHPELAYLERNHNIVDTSHVLLACPGGFEEEIRSGTWATIRYARRVGKPVMIVWPDGSTDMTEG